MLYVVTGGSGSGKSEYAEQLAMDFAGSSRIYLATMRIWDAEGEQRVKRHRRMRQGKGFVTAEQHTDLKAFTGSADVILLECMSNLAVNEFYQEEQGAAERIIQGIQNLQSHCTNLIIVTNEVFSDGLCYDPETERYIRLLGHVNRWLGETAEHVTEVVFGIPLTIK